MSSQTQSEAYEPWTIKFHGRHKSIENMIWEEVPPFAILTGRNGSGKTHL